MPKPTRDPTRKLEREFLCRVRDSAHEYSAYAQTRSKARYRHWLKVVDVYPDLRLFDIKVRAGRPPNPPSMEWRTLGISERQRELARHALGFDGRQKVSYRNHFCVGPGGDTHDEWMDLVSKGLATYRADSQISGDSDVFWCTEKLALAVRDSYEHLGKEFRG